MSVYCPKSSWPQNRAGWDSNKYGVGVSNFQVSKYNKVTWLLSRIKQQALSTDAPWAKLLNVLMKQRRATFVCIKQNINNKNNEVNVSVISFGQRFGTDRDRRGRHGVDAKFRFVEYFDLITSFIRSGWSFCLRFDLPFCIDFQETTENIYLRNRATSDILIPALKFVYRVIYWQVPAVGATFCLLKRNVVRKIILRVAFLPFRCRPIPNPNSFHIP